MIMPADLEWRLIYILVSCQEYSSRVRLMQTDFANVCFFDLSNHDIMRMPTCPGLELHFPAKIVAREKNESFYFLLLGIMEHGSISNRLGSLVYRRTVHVHNEISLWFGCFAN